MTLHYTPEEAEQFFAALSKIDGGKKRRGPKSKLPDADLRQQYEAGATIVELAAKYGYSTHPIYVALRRAGAKMRRRGIKKGILDLVRAEDFRARYEAGETLDAIGARYRITRERVRQILVKLGVSNRDHLTPHMQKRSAAKAERDAAKREAIDARKRLRQAKVDALAAAYRELQSTILVAERFGMCQSNVDRILRPLGIIRKRNEPTTVAARKRMRLAHAQRLAA